MAVYAVGGGSQWDERRNSSQTLVSPTALLEARKAQAWYEREKPEWWRWVTGGQPELTVEQYERVRSKRQARKR